MQTTLDKILTIIPAEAGWIYLLDPGQPDKGLTLAAQRGLAETAFKAAAISPVAGFMGRVLHEGLPVVATQMSAAGCLGVEEPTGATRADCALVPLQSHERPVGVLGIFNTRPYKLTPREVSLLSAIGHQVGIVIENVQLTKEAAAVTLLREVDRLRSELIANVSHELRTPLGLIKIFATSLRRKNANFDPDTRDKFLQGIEDETTRLEEIVDNLLDLGRIENERLSLDRRPADLAELAQKIMAALTPQLGDYRVEADFPSGSLVAEVDPKRLEQVLRNLLNNAIKYSPPGSVIKVQGKREPGGVYLSVQDEGIGIPAEEQARIFERFYRVDNAVTRRTRGAGLGLAVCQGIIEAHGGQMGVRSSPGCGSTFWIILPAGELRPET
jgi:K+-sensing histidine kinase KdpD